ncbi:MAG TPA: GntG family PLP-dependent aldolase [Methanomassiliicoccales archaeon]|nr:GntG family PLP-dependent aldolase [Methanomassiliicoccales archaeon]
MKIIDLRSDTVTLPTEEMIRSITEAEFGDDVSGEDPTVNRLEELSADIFGTESALLMPSGTQSNLVGLMAHCKHGDEVIMDSESHVYYYEVGGMSAVAGLIPRFIKGKRGVFKPDQVHEAYRGKNIHFPNPTLVEIENTHNRAGGTIWKPQDVAAVTDVARDLDMGIHMDGARIFNAAVALGISVKEYASKVDSITFCLSKGLSAPLGSVLVGSEEYIERSRKIRKMLGGGMRQAGIIAAPGIVALTKMVSRLEEDHRNARLLADGLNNMEGLSIDMESVQTNIVVVDLYGTGMDAATFSAKAKNNGILVSIFGPHSIRFVTHYGIGTDDIETTIERMETIF